VESKTELDIIRSHSMIDSNEHNPDLKKNIGSAAKNEVVGITVKMEEAKDPRSSDNNSDSGSLSTSESVKSSDKHSRHKSSNGATSVIRRRLHFADEAMWKRFTTRRLQLVESLSLSSKKASEQYDQINVCAHTLMSEFGFPEETLPEFDKLVRLAIQSVRRNKKRSEKRQALKILQEERKTKRIKFQQQRESSKFFSSLVYDDGEPTDVTSDNEHGILGSTASIKSSTHSADGSIQGSTRLQSVSRFNGMSSSTSSFGHSASTGLSMHTDSHQRFTSPSLSRLAINSLIAPIIPEHDKLPSIQKIPESPEFEVSSQKILQQIKRSKTCYDFSCSSGSQENAACYEMLEEMGSACLSAAILFTLEKWFDHLLLDSASYIKLRMKSDMTLSLIVKNLDKSSAEVNRLSNYVAAQLFKKLIGGCVKDFGFDAVLYPLCDIFRGVIGKDYPLISKETKMHQWLSEQRRNGSNNSIPSANHSHSSDHHTIGPLPTREGAISDNGITSPSSLPSILTSPVANTINLPPISRSLKTVIISFNGRDMKLFYSPQSNAPPTVVELLTNSRMAFGISDSNRLLRIQNRRSGLFVNSDFELEKIFRGQFDKIELQLVFGSGKQNFLNLNPEANKFANSAKKSSTSFFASESSRILPPVVGTHHSTILGHQPFSGNKLPLPESSSTHGSTNSPSLHGYQRLAS